MAGPRLLLPGPRQCHIIAVTWTFSNADGAINGTKVGYPDIVYAEQCYTKAFKWTIQGSKYLHFTPEALANLQSIAMHETRPRTEPGPLRRSRGRTPAHQAPANQKVYNPEAVMNPGYLGGEKRIPYPTDVAGLGTMY